MATGREGRDLDLAGLAKASRVSPRTIRYYIQQGLLPSPGKRGRAARYERGTLDRLELIKRLQRDRWPLGRIASHMAELDDDGVRRELGAPAKGGGSPPASVVPQRSTWERVRVTPSLEISVRTTLSGQQRKRADRVIEAAKTILGVD
jgi:DNA-binding transcriptional MerR regulator